jgi:hypothetical protein
MDPSVQRQSGVYWVGQPPSDWTAPMTRGRVHFTEDLQEPHSNLCLVQDWVALADRTEAAEAQGQRWAVLDGSGHRQGGTSSRAEAVRLMSRLALRRHSVLPLTVVDSEGRPTGDQLA